MSVDRLGHDLEVTIKALTRFMIGLGWTWSYVDGERAYRSWIHQPILETRFRALAIPTGSDEQREVVDQMIEACGRYMWAFVGGYVEGGVQRDELLAMVGACISTDIVIGIAIDGAKATGVKITALVDAAAEVLMQNGVNPAMWTAPTTRMFELWQEMGIFDRLRYWSLSGPRTEGKA